MSNLCRMAVILTLVACGGGGDGTPTGNDEPVATVAINGAGNTDAFEMGDTRSLSTTLRDAQNRILTGRTVAWSTSPAGRASLSTASGTSTTVTAIGLGAVTVTATSEGKNGSVTFTVVEAGQAPTQASVSLTGNSFDPSQVTIKNGGTVTWSYTSSVQHNLLWDDAVPAGVNNVNPFNNGMTVSFTFNGTGAYDYHCSLHSGMIGRVTVVP